MNEVAGFVGLAALLLGLFAWLRADVARVERRLAERLDRLERGHSDLRERMAKLEGLLEGLREAIAGRRDAA